MSIRRDWGRGELLGVLGAEGADGGSGAFGGRHDDVNVLGGHHSGAVGPGDGESVAEVERFAGGEVLFDYGPLAEDGRVAEQAADDCASLAGLFDAEEGLAGHPSVGLYPFRANHNKCPSLGKRWTLEF